MLAHGRAMPTTIEGLLENGGVGFDTNSCDIVPDHGEESFEGVRFSTYFWHSDRTDELFISRDDFDDALRLVTKSHLHTHPEDEAKLRKIFVKHQISF
jgi:hypothetical protein